MKLYVIVRSDLPWVHQAVQAGHTVAQYLLDYPECGWNNGTLVYLRVPTEDDLKMMQFLLIENDKKFSEFREPDRNHELTALAALGIDKLVKGMPLL